MNSKRAVVDWMLVLRLVPPHSLSPSFPFAALLLSVIQRERERERERGGEGGAARRAAVPSAVMRMDGWGAKREPN